MGSYVRHGNHAEGPEDQGYREAKAVLAFLAMSLTDLIVSEEMKWYDLGLCASLPSPPRLSRLPQQGQARVTARPPFVRPPFAFRDPRRKDRPVQLRLDPPLQRFERQCAPRVIEQEEPIDDQRHRHLHGNPPGAETDQRVQLQHPLEPAKHDLDRPAVRPQLRDPLRTLLQQAGENRAPLALGIGRVQHPPQIRASASCPSPSTTRSLWIV